MKCLTCKLDRDIREKHQKERIVSESGGVENNAVVDKVDDNEKYPNEQRSFPKFFRLEQFKVIHEGNLRQLEESCDF